MHFHFWRKLFFFFFLIYTRSSFYNFNETKENFAALTSTWNNSSILRGKHEKGAVEIITLATRVQSIVWTKLTVTARRRVTLLSEKRSMSATRNPVCSKTTSGAHYRSVSQIIHNEGISTGRDSFLGQNPRIQADKRLWIQTLKEIDPVVEFSKA